VAVAVHNINVPKETNEDKGQALELGEFAVELNPQLSKGDSAPLFDVETLDGKRVRLQDLRGKIVLVAFWASWCGECVADIPTWKEIYKQFGDDKRFAMIGLSLDNSAQTVRSFTKSQEMSWTQGILGDWSRSKIPSQYAVSFIPAMYLIDQNGTVAEVLRGPKMREAIEKALAGLE
jgi:peroxiredoxin